MKTFSSLLLFTFLLLILSCQDNTPQEIFRTNCDDCNFVEEEFIVKNCVLDSISLKNQPLEKISFSNSILKNSSFTNTEFIKSNFSKTHFVNCNLENAIFKDCEITGVKFKKCNLTNARFHNQGIYVFNDWYAKNENWLEVLPADWKMPMKEMQQYYQIELEENEELGKHYLIKMLKPLFPREGILQF